MSRRETDGLQGWEVNECRTTLDEGKRRGSNIHLIRRRGQMDLLCKAERKNPVHTCDTHSNGLEIGNLEREIQGCQTCCMLANAYSQ